MQSPNIIRHVIVSPVARKANPMLSRQMAIADRRLTFTTKQASAVAQAMAILNAACKRG